MDVVGLGALNLDLIYKVNFDKLKGVKRGLERKVNFEEFERIKKLLESEGEFVTKSGGGSAANTIYALSKMGFSCGFIGKAGEDEEGDFLIEDLSQAGVDTSRIKREGKSGICLVLVDDEGERSIFVLPNINNDLSLKDIDLSYIERAKFFHNTSFLGEKPFHAQRESILKTSTLVSFDPGEPYIRQGWNTLFPLLKKTYVLFLTKREIEILTGIDFKRGAQEILKWGVKVVVCKLGQQGSWIASHEGEWFISARKTEALDTTGAGDVYAAGFLAGLLKSMPLFECAKIGTEAAAESVTGFGRFNYPERDFLSKFLTKKETKSEF